MLKKDRSRLTFFCTKPITDIVKILGEPDFDDNLVYDFGPTETPGVFSFSVRKIPYQIGKRRPIHYLLWFEQDEADFYLVIEEQEARSVFTQSALEPELYRFFIQKCECEPVEISHD